MIAEVANHLWQSTAFAVAVGLLALAFRKNRAQVRYWLWLSASVKFLVPFSLLMGLGYGLLSRLAAGRVATAIAAPALTGTIVKVTQPFPSALTIEPAAQHTTNWIPIVILGVWACGFAAVALARFRAWRRVRSALRASTPIDIPAPVAVRASSGLLEPGVVGFFRSTVLLPEDLLKTLTRPQMEAVLAHELSHARRRDNLTAAIHMMVEALFWFYPLVWWIGARLMEERERACDESVLMLGSEPREYTDAILNVCKHCIKSPVVCVSGIIGSDLKRRIVHIMARHIGRGLTPGRKWLLGAAAVVAIATPLALGGAGPRGAGAVLRQIGSTYRNLKSYSFTGEVQETTQVDSSEYRSTYPLTIVSAGGPHVGARFYRGTGIRKIAGNGPPKPGLLYPMPPLLGFQFFRFPEGVKSARILGQASVVANGESVPCLIVEIHWRAAANNPEMVKGGLEKLWVGKASHLVLKTSFAGLNGINPTHPHLVERWVISFQSYKLNKGVPSWYRPHPQHPFRQGESSAAKRQRLSPPPAVGSIAPEFILKNLRGRSESLASARGQPVLIDFWATWCGPCRGEETTLEKVEKQLPRGSFRILRITNEQSRRVQDFFTRTHKRFSTLVQGQSVWDRYGVHVLPTLVLVNSAGRVAQYHMGSLGEKTLIADIQKAR